MLTEKLALLFAFIVITPLALRLAADPQARYPQIYRFAIRFHPIAALCGGVALALSDGLPAKILALPWLLETGLIALWGAARFFSRRNLRLDELVLDAGLAYTVIGGAWFVIWRFGITPLDFGTTIIILTAVHFHYISLTAMVFAAMLGRTLTEHRKIYQAAAVGMIVAPQIVAAGITFSLALELIGAIVIAASLVAVTGLTLFTVIPRIEKSLPKNLLRIASIIVLFTMAFAVAYPLGRLTDWWGLSFAQMLRWHGVLNAIVFGFCGLLGWFLLARDKSLPIP
jgi:hypothetical protein